MASQTDTLDFALISGERKHSSESSTESEKPTGASSGEASTAVSQKVQGVLNMAIIIMICWNFH
jgi:hypothetical protein